MSDAAPAESAGTRTGALWLLAVVIGTALFCHPSAYDDHPLKWGAAFVLGAVGFALPSVRRALDRPMGGPALWLGVALALAFVSSWGLSSLDLSTLRSIAALVTFVVVLVAAREVFWEQAGLLLRGLLLVGAGLSLVAIGQALGVDLVYGEDSRRAALATLGNQSAFAAWLAPLVPLAFVRASPSSVADADREPRGLALLALGLMVVALVLAGRRGGWLAAGLGLLLVAAWRARANALPSLRRPALVTVAGALVGVLATLLAPEGEAGADSVLGLERRSNEIRAAVLSRTADLVEEAPLLGQGPSGFAKQFPRVRDPEEAQQPTRGGARSLVDHPHCEPLRQAAESGIPMAAALVLFTLGVLLHLWRLGAPDDAGRPEAAARRDDGRTAEALAAAWVAALAASLSWSTLYDAPTAMMAAVLAGGALASRVEVESRAPRVWTVRAASLLLPLGLLLLGTPPATAEWRIASAWGGLERVDGVPQLRDEAERSDFLASIESAARLDPSSASRQTLAAAFHVQNAPPGHPEARSRLDTACDLLRRALRGERYHVGALALLAEVEVRRGELGAADRALQRLARLEPWNGSAAERLDALLRRHGREVEALLSLYRSEGEAAIPRILERVEALRDKGEPEQAAQVLDRIRSQAPRQAAVQRAFAVVLQELGDVPGAREAGRLYAEQRLRDEGPVAALALGEEGGREAEQGSILLALGIHQALVEDIPRDPARHTEYARALQRAGLPDEELEQRRLAQLGWTVVNIVQHADWHNAGRTLALAADRYGGAGRLAERLLEAAIRCGEGDPAAALQILQQLADGSGAEVLPWIVPALDGLFRDRDSARELRRLGVSRQ